ncbi:MAG: transposase [Methanobrevibacter sp.]|nr:transposase [Candidatus Methanovirga procula]
MAFSIHRLAKTVKKDVVYMYLSGYQMSNQNVSHSTIIRFKKEHNDLIMFLNLLLNWLKRMMCLI